MYSLDPNSGAIIRKITTEDLRLGSFTFGTDGQMYGLAQYDMYPFSSVYAVAPTTGRISLVTTYSFPVWALIASTPPPFAKPLLRIAGAPGQGFNLSAWVTSGARLALEASDDLIQWTPLFETNAVGNALEFLDPTGAGTKARFYRLSRP